MKFAARLNVTFTAAGGGEENNVEVDFPIHPNVTTAGHCNKNDSPQDISFTFFDDWKLTLVFEKLDGNAAVTSAELEYNTAYFDNVANNLNESRVNLTLFEVPLGNSYTCETDTLSFDNVRVDFTGIQIQAFKPGNEEFGAAVSCTDDGGSDSELVPIIAGVVLAVIVIVVLVIFFIQRSRQHTGM